MGELADDMICGVSCSWCGVYFKKEHGYPVACHDCFDSERKAHPKEFEPVKVPKGWIHKLSGVQRAIYSEL